MGYWSRNVNAAERNHSTTERKCLAVVWASLRLLPCVEGTRFTVRTDHATLKWMLHMDGARGRLARWRLKLAELGYMVQTRPGASLHAADTMLRISTPVGDEGAIPDAVPCVAFPNSLAAWPLTPETQGGLLSHLTLAELLGGQADDGWCKEVRAAMDGNDTSRLREDPNGPLVRTAPADRAAQVYVPTHMHNGVIMQEHYPPHAGHPGANKMYTSMRRWFYWESAVEDVYAFLSNCTQCERNRVCKRQNTCWNVLLNASVSFAAVNSEIQETWY